MLDQAMIANVPAPTNAPAVHPQLGEATVRYTYTDETGTPIVVVYRFDKSDNRDKSPRKTFRPYDLSSRKWEAPEVRPLYRLDALRLDKGNAVIVVEGEKCADALNEIGILSTTAFGGCNGVGKTDFEPLKDRNVIIWPDNDTPGQKYANDVAVTLRKVGASSIRVVDLSTDTLAMESRNVNNGFLDTLRNMVGNKPNPVTLRNGWDAADAIADGWSPLRIRELIGCAVPYTYTDTSYTEGSIKGDKSFKEMPAPIRDNSFKGIDLFKDDPEYENETGSLKLKRNEEPSKLKEWGKPDMSVLNPRRNPPQFPLELFGPFWSRWIADQAEGCSSPVDYVAMTLLSAVSTLIGCSRRISPWPKWSEPPMLWIALVGDPSSNKSPALDTVLNLMRKIEMEGAETLKDKNREYEAELLAAQCHRQDWEKALKDTAKSGGAIPPMPVEATEPNKPERPRIFVSDTTPEALARLLSHNEKGLLTVRDELAGWIGSFNRYASGQGGDRAFWLEAYGGRPYTIDRARNGGEAITIPHLAASIIGGIQPDKLQRLLLDGDDDGLTARILYIWPNKAPLKRPQDSPDSPQAETALRWLNSLNLVSTDENGTHAAIAKLTEEAATFFQDWRSNHADDQPDGPLAGWWGKMPGLCLRLALCFDYLDRASTSREESFQIETWAIEAATIMIDTYLKPMAVRAYGDASLPQAERNAATLAKKVVKEGWERINTRELQRKEKLPGLKTAVDIKEAIELLIDADWLRPDAKREGDTQGRALNDFLVNLVALVKHESTL